MNSIRPNSDSKEIKKFEGISHRWWDKKGPFRGLHEMNPIRVSYVSDRAQISNKRILDIGCGGGILCEALAKIGGHVTGIDLNTAGLRVAEKHAAANHLAIQYQNISVEDLAKTDEHAYDVITCMELLEHVPDPFSVIRSSKKLLKPGGHVFFSTINKTFRSYLLAIVMAEYVLRLMEKNTHNPKKFIPPLQLRNWGEKAGLTFVELSGIFYFPYIPICRLSRNTDVNYIIHFCTET